MGKKTRADTIRDIIARRGSFLNLRADYKKMQECMRGNGGADAFGAWGGWRDVFLLRDELYSALGPKRASGIFRP